MNCKFTYNMYNNQHCKNGQIQINLFHIKLNTNLAPLTLHFNLKMLKNIKEMTQWAHFS